MSWKSPQAKANSAWRRKSRISFLRSRKSSIVSAGAMSRKGRNLTIHVFRNGDEETPAKIFRFQTGDFGDRRAILKDLPSRIDLGTGKIKRQVGEALIECVQMLFSEPFAPGRSLNLMRFRVRLYMLSGSPLVRRDQLTDGGYYVGVPQEQSFKKANYNTDATPSSTSPTRKHSIVSHFSR